MLPLLLEDFNMIKSFSKIVLQRYESGQARLVNFGIGLSPVRRKRTMPKSTTGQAVMVAVILFLIISVIIIEGLAFPTLKQAKIASQLLKSRGSFFLAEAGLEDVVYRLSNGYEVLGEEVLAIDGNYVTTLIEDIPDGKTLISEGNVQSYFRKLKMQLLVSEGISFHYGVQSDVGGIRLENDASIRGNVFSNGSVIGANDNVVRGDIISAGLSGLAQAVNATGTVYAHTITNSKVCGDAYYQSIDSPSLNFLNNPDRKSVV